MCAKKPCPKHKQPCINIYASAIKNVHNWFTHRTPVQILQREKPFNYSEESQIKRFAHSLRSQSFRFQITNRNIGGQESLSLLHENTVMVRELTFGVFWKDTERPDVHFCDKQVNTYL